MQVIAVEPFVLLIDFCGAEPLLALMRGHALAGTEPLPERGAAAGWLPALKHLLNEHALHPGDLHAVGVVAGPGSFTGVRTGLAAAKGLCEATGLPLATVSRLAVLARAANDASAVAILYAGRGQVYVRTPCSDGVAAAEVLVDVTEVEALVARRPLVIAEPQLAESLVAYRPRLIRLGSLDILPLVEQELLHPASLVRADANYVRSESQIYRKLAAAQTVEAS